jgi:hypothetical protein
MATSFTEGGEVPGGLVVAFRLEDVTSPLRNGRPVGPGDRSALVIGGTVFCKVVAVAAARVRRDGRVQAQGSPAEHATLGPAEEWLDRPAGPGGLVLFGETVPQTAPFCALGR